MLAHVARLVMHLGTGNSGACHAMLSKAPKMYEIDAQRKDTRSFTSFNIIKLVRDSQAGEHIDCCQHGKPQGTHVLGSPSALLGWVGAAVRWRCVAC